MARIDVTESTVLARIVARLQGQLSLNARQCFETVQADSPPEIPVGGGYFVAVAPGPGSFVPEEQVAGNITEDWSVTVTAFTRVQLDSAGHDTAVLRDTSRGLLELKRRLLKALCGHDLTTESGDTLLRQYLYAQHCSAPQIGAPLRAGRADGSVWVGWISITFGVSFDWDIR